MNQLPAMDRLDEWSFKSKKMDLEEDFYFDYGAEEMTDYQDPGELVAALKQKEEEVILAAQLGNALLLENRQLKEQSDKLHEQYSDRLEVRRYAAVSLSYCHNGYSYSVEWKI